MWKWHSRTPHRIAQEMGMNALLITSGAESLRTGLEQAIPIGTSFQKIRKENFFLTRIMRGEAENITVLDEAGELYYSVPGDLPPDLLAVMREKMPEIPKNTSRKLQVQVGHPAVEKTGSILATVLVEASDSTKIGASAAA